MQKLRNYWLIGIITLSNLMIGRIDLALTSEPHVGGDAIGHLEGWNKFMAALENGSIPFWDTSWFGGSPMFLYYMIVPFLFIAIFSYSSYIIGSVLGLLGALPIFKETSLRITLIFGSLLSFINLDPNAAFKLVIVLSFALLPLAIWWGLKPLVKYPEIYAFASLLWVYTSEYQFHGANAISSTIGEFSFGIATIFAFITLGMVFRDLRTAFIPLTIVLLSHIIVGVFASIIIGAYYISKIESPEKHYLTLAIFLGWATIFTGNFLLAAATILILLKNIQVTQRFFFQISLLFIPAVISSLWWTVPFLATRHSITNPEWPKLQAWEIFDFTAIGIVISLAALISFYNISKKKHVMAGNNMFIYSFFTLIGLFIVIPEDFFWNGRLVPFIGILACFIVAERLLDYIKSLTSEKQQLYKIVFSAIVIIPVYLPLVTQSNAGAQQTLNFSQGFYQGFDNVSASEEWFTLTEMVGRIDECGIIAHENFGENDQFGRYGSPASMTFLPHYTQPCVGVTVGLYTESSASALFHYRVNHSISNETRYITVPAETPKSDLDVGLKQAKQLGIKWFLLHSDTMKQQAAETENIVLIDATETWSLYEIQNFSNVTPVNFESIQWENIDYELWRSNRLEKFDGEETLVANGKKPVWVPILDNQVPLNVTVKSGVIEGTGSESFVVNQSWHDYWVAEGAEIYPVGPNQILVLPTNSEFKITWEVPSEHDLFYLISVFVFIVVSNFALVRDRTKEYLIE